MRQIGVMVDLMGRYGRAVLEGVTDFSLQCRQLKIIAPQPFGYSSLSGWTQWDIDGMIIQMPALDWGEEIRSRGIKAVNVSSIMRETGFPTVTLDNVGIGRMAAEYFLNRGFRNFAFIGGFSYFAQLRGDAFVARTIEAGYSCMRPPINTLDISVHGSEWTDLCNLLKAAPYPLAIFAPNDHSAMNVLDVCAAANIVVPEQAAVLGCDNDELFYRRAQPPLSSIDVPAEKVGFEAAQTLIDLIEGRAVPEVKLLQPLSIVTRKSTDILAINDPEIMKSLQFIRENAHRQIQIKDVVAQVPLTRRTLELRFREIVGRPILAEIIRVKIEMAKELLLDTDLKMPEIAIRCGFTRAPYVGEVFRRKLDMTPTEFRRRNKK